MSRKLRLEYPGPSSGNHREFTRAAPAPLEQPLAQVRGGLLGDGETAQGMHPKSMPHFGMAASKTVLAFPPKNWQENGDVRAS